MAQWTPLSAWQGKSPSTFLAIPIDPIPSEDSVTSRVSRRTSPTQSCALGALGGFAADASGSAFVETATGPYEINALGAGATAYSSSFFGAGLSYDAMTVQPDGHCGCATTARPTTTSAPRAFCRPTSVKARRLIHIGQWQCCARQTSSYS
jgi:hypothetical protein